MAKRVARKPQWLENDRVTDIYSVSACTSEDFCDYINYWKHNGYWLFASPLAIEAVANEDGASLEGTKLFFYEVYEFQSYENDPIWEEFSPEESFSTDVVMPREKALMGFDVVSFSSSGIPECSYLSCNHMAEEIKVNEHCLLTSLEREKELINQKAFEGCEPGPCRIMAVYEVSNA